MPVQYRRALWAGVAAKRREAYTNRSTLAGGRGRTLGVFYLKVLGAIPRLVGGNKRLLSTPHRHCLHSKLVMSGVPVGSTLVQ